MTTAKTTNWKKVLLFGALACVSVVVLATVGAVATFSWANAAADELGEPTPVPVARIVTVADRAAAAAVSPRQTTRLDIELHDGKFEVLTGPPGTDVELNGTYAENYYELIEERGTDDVTGEPTMAIRLRPTSSFMVRMMAGLTDFESSRPPNELSVTIPAGLSFALTLEVGQGQSQIDLDGLTLTELDADLSMGEHHLGFDRPLAEELPLMRLNSSMGAVVIDRLGNARAHELRASSRMGEFTFDLGGDWPTDGVSDLSFEHSMGELRLRIPTYVRISADSDDSVRLGETRWVDAGDAPDDPDAPTLRLNTSTTMGETRITRYEAAPAEELTSRAPTP